MHTFVENGVCQVILLALTSSIRLDQEERNRSFQKTKETYLGIMREVAGNVSGSGLSVETGVPVIQYSTGRQTGSSVGVWQPGQGRYCTLILPAQR